MKKPNFLWISLEDSSPRFGCYGDPVARTPFLDRLAAQGCRYTHAFSTAGVCAPARSAIITGMYPISIGTHHMRTTHTEVGLPDLPTPYAALIPPYVKCFTEYLRAAGYYCTNNDKTDYQFPRPFTAWDEDGPGGHWRKRRDPKQPFFAVFNLGRTHESRAWAKSCPEVTFDPARMVVPPYFPDTPEVRMTLARMYTQLEKSDQELQGLLNQLEEDGLAEETLVFVWSDHGPLPRGKRWPYDSGIHVPLLVRWPGGIAPGTVSNRLVSTIDLGPTLLSLAGLEIPSHLQGQAFLGPREAPPRPYVFASRDRHDTAYDMVRAARDRRFKYLRNYHPELPYMSWIPYLNKHPIQAELWRCFLAGELKDEQLALFRTGRPAEELYDTEADPHEVRNLAGKPEFQAELLRLRGALDGWLEQVGDMGRIAEAEMVRQWFPGGQRPKTSAPNFVPLNALDLGMQLSPAGGSFRGRTLLQLHCVTQGASMGYTFEEGEHPNWRLYSGPFELPRGTTAVRAMAIRIGYHTSPEVRAVFTVTD